ncbi:lipid-A-disaccharide synthase [Acuticoccus sp. MNP-M23]|uniref:lipid-A-disaccharide synthase n=1 Tax=Acuticoccus sp. MNP-M23 TaxID=3072793 RepID=UPI002814F0AE|nr:lipid-A-disaccharide synthase [Acuticoccus sp. MNP-M23]WMS41190.1 lipid-A-disaccharide synthase [Acuticoccus sp. MNP-M23]
MKPLKVAIFAGEVSGDHLAGALMAAMNRARGIRWRGVGGDTMLGEGLAPVFAMEAIEVNGFDAIVKRLPHLLARIREAADAVIADPPDVLVIVDAPEFTHRVARRVRRALPHLPIVDFVSPTVWAWRPGRARAMRAYVDLVLALFPFEPAVHAKLGGPACVYVGHPLFEAMQRPAPPSGEALLVLPGSRRGEIERLMPVFGQAAAAAAGEREIQVLAVPHRRAQIEALAADWPVAPRIVSGPNAKAETFGAARAALAASGTVTLELAAARVPMVVAYRLDGIGRLIKALHPVLPIVKAPSMVLTNIVIGRNEIPAFLDDEGTPEALAAALRPLLADEAARMAQQATFDAFHGAMAVDGSPGENAARAILDFLAARSG